MFILFDQLNLQLNPKGKKSVNVQTLDTGN